MCLRTYGGQLPPVLHKASSAVAWSQSPSLPPTCNSDDGSECPENFSPSNARGGDGASVWRQQGAAADVLGRRGTSHAFNKIRAGEWRCAALRCVCRSRRRAVRCCTWIRNRSAFASVSLHLSTPNSESPTFPSYVPIAVAMLLPMFYSTISQSLLLSLSKTDCKPTKMVLAKEFVSVPALMHLPGWNPTALDRTASWTCALFSMNVPNRSRRTQFLFI